MARRRSDGSDLERARPRQRESRSEQEAQKQQKATEQREQKRLEAQDQLGNAFLAELAGAPEQETAGPPGASATSQETLQRIEHGGIEDEPPPQGPDDPFEHWAGVRQDAWTERSVERFDRDTAHHQLPDEDLAWLAMVPSEDPSPWPNPTPQPSPAVLGWGIRRWVLALAPWLIDEPTLAPCLFYAYPSPGCFHLNPSRPLLGAAAAASVATSLAAQVGRTTGNHRLEHGLALASAPPSTGRPSVEAHTRDSTLDPWWLACARAGLQVRLPPPPNANRPRPIHGADEPIDFEALFTAQLGPADPDAVAQGALDETLMTYERLTKELARKTVDIAVATGRPSDGQAAMEALQSYRDTQRLIREILVAGRTRAVALNGRLNGANRVHRAMGSTYNRSLEAFARTDDTGTMAVPVSSGAAAPVLEAWRQGASPPDLEESPVSALVHQLTTAVGCLRGGDATAAAQIGAALRHEGHTHQDGVLMATGVLLELEALVQRGRSAAARTLHLHMATAFKTVGARTGLSLLARWTPEEPPRVEA